MVSSDMSIEVVTYNELKRVSDEYRKRVEEEAKSERKLPRQLLQNRIARLSCNEFSMNSTKSSLQKCAN